MPIDPFDDPKRQAQIGQLRAPDAFEGFDFARGQDTKKSAKDSFAAHAKAAAVAAPINDKAALGDWAKQYVMPGMNADGHGVSSVDGDKLRFKNWQGEFDVDFGRGAGADGGALAWQAEDVNAPQEMAAPNAPAAQRQGDPIGALDDATDNSALARIMAELTATSNGEQSPAEREAILQMLQAI
jgi:hypothetical protein